jgi:hypothetical protein
MKRHCTAISTALPSIWMLSVISSPLALSDVPQIFCETLLRPGNVFGKLQVGNDESLRHRQAGNFPALGEERSSPLFYQRSNFDENT